MNRREAIVVLGALLALPQISLGQKPAKRIGFLVWGERPTKADEAYYAAFLEEMRRLGHAEGRDFIMEWRYAENRADRLASFAQELVSLKADVIVTRGTPANAAAKRATATIPIVVAITADPLSEGLVSNLARPGGNITGFWTGAEEYVSKQYDLMASVVPRLSRLAVLRNPVAPSHPPQVKIIRALAEKSGVKIHEIAVRGKEEFESSFAAMAKERAEGLIILGDTLFTQNNAQLGQLALKHRLPSILTGEYADAGGLFSYGVDLRGMFRHAAGYVDKILKGAKPGELPFQQPGRFEFVVNLKTARALGLTIPQPLLLRADRVIR